MGTRSHKLRRRPESTRPNRQRKQPLEFKAFDQAGRFVIRGPDRAGAFAYILIAGSLLTTVGSALWASISVIVGPFLFIGEPSAYLQYPIATFPGALIGFIWLSARRDGVDWLNKQRGDAGEPPNAG